MSSPSQPMLARQPRRLSYSAVVLVVAIAVVWASCGSARTPPSPEDEQAFWDTFRIGGPASDEAEHYESLREMADAADFVVIATFGGIEEGRTVRFDDGANTSFTYADVSLDVEEVIRGRLPSGGLEIEFILSTRTDETDEAIRALKDQLPLGEMLLFIRAKGGANEQGLYRVVNGRALWSELDGALETPLGQLNILSDGARVLERNYEDELKDVQSLADLVDHIRN